MTTMKRTNIFLADEDQAAIELLRARFGLSTSSDAIRFALRVLADSDVRIVVNGSGANAASGLEQVSGRGVVAPA